MIMKLIKSCVPVFFYIIISDDDVDDNAGEPCPCSFLKMSIMMITMMMMLKLTKAIMTLVYLVLQTSSTFGAEQNASHSSMSIPKKISKPYPLDHMTHSFIRKKTNSYHHVSNWYARI